MKKIFLLIVLVCINCHSQNLKCDTVKLDKVYYVTFEIQSKENYISKMTGIFSNYNPLEFNKDNVESFISSFYNESFYSPNLIKGYKNMLCECIDSNSVNLYMNKNKAEVSKIINSIDEKPISYSITLNTGEKVFFKVINISGTFFKVSKLNKGIFTTSMEYDINEINEINDVYVPFDNIKSH